MTDGDQQPIASLWRDASLDDRQFSPGELFTRAVRAMRIGSEDHVAL
jgi:hypothetical protein